MQPPLRHKNHSHNRVTWSFSTHQPDYSPMKKNFQRYWIHDRKSNGISFSTVVKIEENSPVTKLDLLTSYISLHSITTTIKPIANRTLDIVNFQPTNEIDGSLNFRTPTHEINIRPVHSTWTPTIGFFRAKWTNKLIITEKL